MSIEDEILTYIRMWSSVSCLDRMGSKTLSGDLRFLSVLSFYLGSVPASSDRATGYLCLASTFLVT